MLFPSLVCGRDPGVCVCTGWAGGRAGFSGGGLSPLLHQETLALNSPRTEMPFLYQADLVSWGEKRCLILGKDAQLVHFILRLAQTDRLLLPANNSL